MYRSYLLLAFLLLGVFLLVLALLRLLGRVHDVRAQLVRHVHHVLGAAGVALVEDGPVLDLVLWVREASSKPAKKNTRASKTTTDDTHAHGRNKTRKRTRRDLKIGAQGHHPEERQKRKTTPKARRCERREKERESRQQERPPT